MKNKRRRAARPARRTPSVLERIQIDVAGIDCGASEHFVSVPPDRDPSPIQSFRTFTADLERLADWLVACRVTSVPMEATGVYWIPLFDILEARGLEVLLVNARHVKHVPGRKSDVEDCEWLRELHSVGLLRGSFRPAGPMLPLRAYLRHREVLVQTAGTYVQRMQKALDKAIRVAGEQKNQDMVRALEAGRAPLNKHMIEMGIRLPNRRNRKRPSAA